MSKYEYYDEEKLEEFAEKYAKKRHEYYRDARDLLSDIIYLEQTDLRTKRRSHYGLEIIPVGIGADGYWLLKKIVANHSRSYWKDEDKLIGFLQIYDITQSIASKLLSEDKKTVNEEVFNDFVNFGKVFEYWTNGVEYRDSLLSQIYYGCQTDTTELRERYDKATSLPLNQTKDERDQENG